MKHFSVALLAYAACALQAGAARSLAVGGVAPCFPLLVLVAALLLVEGHLALVWAAVAGLLSDCLGSDRLGIDVLCFTMAALAVRRSVRLRHDSPPPVVAVTGFAVVFMTLLASAALRLVFASRPVESLDLVVAAAGVAGYSTLLGCAGLITWRVLCKLAPRPCATV